LVELAGDQSLVRFKHEYDRLYRALRRSHDNERILYNKITELSRDMANQTAKLRLALKMSQEDAQAISYLKQELEKTFKVLELSKEREERAKQKIEGMNSKIKVLESNLQQFQAKSAGQSNAINDLKEKKEQLTKGI
jgi:chromosome segregation ATPase